MAKKQKSPEASVPTSELTVTEPVEERRMTAEISMTPRVPEPAPVVDIPVAEESGVTVSIPEGNREPDPAISLDAFVAKLMAERDKPVEVYVPPAPHPRQAEQTRLEMEAGAKRVAENEAEKAVRPVPQPDPGAGTNTPVYRPTDFVPNMKQGNANARPV